MAIHKTEAIVIRTQPFRSSSLIVTSFTRQQGKIKGVAKGVRAERELRGSLYELFNQVEIIYYEKNRSDLHLLSEGFLLESYGPIREKLETLVYASYFAELVDLLTEFHDPHEAIFHLLDFSFCYLPSIAPEKMSRIFEMQLLKEIGWVPYLEGCVHCGSRQTSLQLFFSPVQGVLVCGNCVAKAQDAKPMSEETLTLLRSYLENSLEDSIKLNVSASSQQGLQALMNRFFQARLPRPLKSWNFLEKIKPALTS